MNNLQRQAPGIRKVSDRQCHDEDLNMDYRATEWSYHGHRIDINVDETGSYARADGGNCDGPFDEGGLLVWLARLVAKII